MSDLIDIASKEIGYKEQGNNNTKYGKYTGTNGMAWCHAFVSWCAHQAGVGTSIVPKTASTTVGMSWFKNKGRFKYKGKYTPKRNDLVYFKTGASHVGIVEYVSGNTLHTIEGNTSDKVARRTYPLSYRTITGYGVVSSYISGSSSGGSSLGSGSGVGTGESDGISSGSSNSKSNTYDVAKELKYLKQVLAKTSKPSNTIDPNTYEISSVSPNNNIKVTLTFSHNKKIYDLPVESGMKVTWERKNTPGKLEFTTIADNKKKMYHGDAVSLKINSTPFFFGFIFDMKPTQDGKVSVIVYDQLRYFKNKDSYFYKKKSATKLLRMIAKDFGLKTGTLVDTKYLVTRIDTDKTLFDIMNNCIEETSFVTNKIYTLYDNYGKLMLRTPWKVNVLIDKDTGQSYNYSSSIDSNTYNQVKLAYENESKGTLDIYISKSSKNINKWGLLQYYEKIEDPRVAKLKGKVLLQMYNKVSRTLSIGNARGSTKVRAGCLLPVMLSLYDIKVSSYMLVDKVVHTFENGSHTMDLELSGGGFDSGQ